MSDQIDPAFKAAYRETQGQPVDAKPRRPIVAAQQDGGLVERLKDVSTRMSGHVDAGDVWDAATALAEKDARIAELDAECQQSMLDICRERERAEKAEAQLTASRAECEGLRAERDNFAVTVVNLAGQRDEALKKLNACHWYWPEDDTSSECCAESAQEVVQNIYDWTPGETGNVVGVARGGIVEVTYCASLPTADDTDSDDDFWVGEATREAAQAKIDAEKARRAALSQKETGNAA